MTSESSTAELLARVPVFAALSAADLERVAHVAVRRSLDVGEVLFHEGDRSSTCYVISSGRVRAVRDRLGRTLTLATLGPNEFFGELALFEDERRTATVEALDPTQLIAVLGADMHRLMREHPDISTRLVIALGRRLRETNDRLSRRSFQSVQSRVAAALGELAEDQAGAGEGEIVVRATQADLAQLAGASRESASRFLAVLDRAGVISQGRGRLIIHDPAALARYVV